MLILSSMGYSMLFHSIMECANPSPFERKISIAIKIRIETHRLGEFFYNLILFILLKIFTLSYSMYSVYYRFSQGIWNIYSRFKET